MVAFYVLNAAIGFAFLGDAANPAGIAVIHSIFNILPQRLSCCQLSKGLEKLAYLTIKADEETELPCPEESRRIFSFWMPGSWISRHLRSDSARRLPFHMAEMAQRSYTAMTFDQ